VQVARYASPETKKKYLPRLLKGMKLGLAMAEVEAGSGLTDLKTTARLDGDYYILNGEKRWVGYGGAADVYYTWVREPGTVGGRGIFVLLVDANSPGLHYGKDRGFFGVYQGYRHDLIFKDCRVPKENLLIGPDKLRVVMGAFNTFRLQNAARSQGLAEGALDTAIEYSQTRHQFGRPICEFQMIQKLLSDMIIKVEAGRWLLYKAAVEADTEQAPPLSTSIAKAYCNQMAIEVTTDAMHVLGAYGQTRESDTEWRFRQASLFATATATKEMMTIRIVTEKLGRKFSQRKD